MKSPSIWELHTILLHITCVIFRRGPIYHVSRAPLVHVTRVIWLKSRDIATKCIIKGKIERKKRRRKKEKGISQYPEKHYNKNWRKKKIKEKEKGKKEDISFFYSLMQVANVCANGTQSSLTTACHFWNLPGRGRYLWFKVYLYLHYYVLLVYGSVFPREPIIRHTWYEGGFLLCRVLFRIYKSSEHVTYPHLMSKIDPDFYIACCVLQFNGPFLNFGMASSTSIQDVMSWDTPKQDADKVFMLLSSSLFCTSCTCWYIRPTASSMYNLESFKRCFGCASLYQI